MSKCPKCSSEMEETTRLEKRRTLIAQKNPGKGGYFGERPEEYGMSGFGDLYEDWTVKVIQRKCLKCGHEEKQEITQS